MARPRADQREHLGDLCAFALEIVGAPQDHCERFREVAAIGQMPRNQLFGLRRSFRNSNAARQLERVEAVNVAPGRQDIGVAEQIATGRGADEFRVERMDDAVKLAIGVEQRVDAHPVGLWCGVEDGCPLACFHRCPDDVQAMRNECALDVVEVGGECGDVARVDVDGRRRVADHRLDHRAFVIQRDAPPLNQRLEVGEAFVKSGFLERRRDVRDQRCARTALGEHPF